MKDYNQFLKVARVLLVKLRCRIKIGALSRDEWQLLFSIELFSVVYQLLLEISDHVLYIMVTRNIVIEGVSIIC